MLRKIEEMKSERSALIVENVRLQNYVSDLTSQIYQLHATRLPGDEAGAGQCPVDLPQFPIDHRRGTSEVQRDIGASRSPDQRSHRKECTGAGVGTGMVVGTGMGVGTGISPNVFRESLLNSTDSQSLSYRPFNSTTAEWETGLPDLMAASPKSPESDVFTPPDHFFDDFSESSSSRSLTMSPLKKRRGCSPRSVSMLFFIVCAIAVLFSPSLEQSKASSVSH